MSPTPYLVPPSPSEPTPIDLGDGKKRFLRYTIGTITRLKRLLGKPLIGPDSALKSIDEELLPTLILAGLRNEDMTPCTDVTVEQLEDLSSSYIVYLFNTFTAAWTAGIKPAVSPEKNAPPALPEAATEKKPN